MVDRDDDLRLGMKTSAITLGRLDVPAVMTSYVFYLSIWALALVQHGVNAIFYIAFIPALAQVQWHYRLIRGRSRDGCFRAFRLNHWLGFTVFAGIAVSYALP
jgi:4-hydroxybenzoate polyprenyltransferase